MLPIRMKIVHRDPYLTRTSFVIYVFFNCIGAFVLLSIENILGVPVSPGVVLKT
jgi:hypothetical protein